MLYNIPCRSNPMPYYVDNSLDPDLIWFMDFSNGFTEPITNVTGTNTDTNNFFQIKTDSTMGTYLQCTKTSGKNKIYWNGFQTYFNNIFSTGKEPFTISLWLRAPNWGSYNECVICWNRADGQTGAVFYKDGSYPSKFNARVKNAYWYPSYTNVQDSSWVHWVFVRDSNGGYWYRNGVLDKSYTNDSTMINANVRASEDIQIGNSTRSDWTTVFYADITKIRIYKKALTAALITDLYNKKA